MPKILCLTSHDLDGQDYGAMLRARNLFKLLSRLGDVRMALAGFYEVWQPGHRTHCGGFELLRTVKFRSTRPISLPERLQHELNPRFMNTEWLQAGPQDQAWLDQAVAQHDLVWIHSLQVANGFGRWRWPHSVLDIDDIPSSYHRTQLAQPGHLKHKLALRQKIFRWQRHERTLHERFDALCVCSEPDKVLLGHPEKIFAVPNGSSRPEDPLPRHPACPPRLGFVGNFAYSPNRLGIQWFVEKIWPFIRKKHPTACLRLVGAKSDTGKWPPGSQVEALGWLPDLAAEMATWSLAVVPMLAGAGTRVKIAEAFSHGCPVVATSLGAYGYAVADGVELFLADDAAEFADKCHRLIAEPDTGKKLAARARERFNLEWTWEAQAGRVAAVVEKVLGAKALNAGSDRR